MLPEWKSSPVVKKLEKPILTPGDIPYKSTCVYNAGITKFNGKYVMTFRNDYAEWGKNWGLINIGIATSDDGIKQRKNPLEKRISRRTESKRRASQRYCMYFPPHSNIHYVKSTT